MAIEIIPKKPEPKRITLGDIFFYLLIVLAIACLAVYFILGQIGKKANEKLAYYQGELAKKNADDEALEKRIILVRDKINDFALLRKKHVYVSNVLLFLEKYVHPNVILTKFSFKVANSSIALSGEADSFVALGQQIGLFEKGEMVNGVSLKQVSVTREGNIVFDVEISFSPSILIQKTAQANN